VAVGPGDLVIADCDGVVIVPYARIDQVIESLKGVKAAEAALLPRVKAGLRKPDWLDGMMASSAIKTID
jgi:4-hydroxy-4-methyl-2-oxoglutarate aldolase